MLSNNLAGNPSRYEVYHYRVTITVDAERLFLVE